MKTRNRKIRFRALALAALGLIISLAPIQQGKGAGFVEVSPMNKARNFFTATLLPNGKVLVAGGFDLGSSAELYDPATDTWKVTGSLRRPRAYHQATLLPNGKVLVAGSLQTGGGCQATTSAELYDPATGTWALTGPMKHARCGSTATLLPNGKVLVVYGERGPPSAAELYDPASGTWTDTGSPSTLFTPPTLLRNGKVLVGAELYDPGTGKWTTTGAPSRDYTTATLLLNGKVLAAGGFPSTTELYDPESGTWSATGSLTWVRGNCPATLLRNGQVLITGGYEQETDTTIASAELYNPATGTWTEIAMNGPRNVHTATLLPNGKVLVAGDAPELLSSAELYEPDEPLLTLLRNPDRTLSLSWTGAGALEQTESLTVPNWQPAPSQTNPQSITTTDPMKFFRVKAE